jgi:hypothetical protein
VGSFDVVIQYLKDEGIKHQILDDHALKVGWTAAPSDYWQYVIVSRTDIESFHGEKVQFAFVPEMRVPNEQLWNALDFLNRINWATAVGNWELDFADGQLRWRAGMQMESPVTRAQVDYLTTVGAFAVEKAMPALASIMFGGKSAEAAYAAME